MILPFPLSALSSRVRSPRGGLQPRRCSRCNHLYLARFGDPAPDWIALCRRCQRETRDTLLALLLAFVLAGMLILVVGL